MESFERKHLAKINKHFKGLYHKMRHQTCNPKSYFYKKFKALGINSDAWKYFDDFYNDMYEEYLQVAFDVVDCYRIELGRYDDEESFCKENCYFYIVYLENQQKEMF